MLNLHWTHHGSLGSGRLRWIDIKSDAYWLNAFLSHPSSTAFFISADIFVGKITARPSSPGASGELFIGGIKTPLSKRKKVKKSMQLSQCVFTVFCKQNSINRQFFLSVIILGFCRHCFEYSVASCVMTCQNDKGTFSIWSRKNVLLISVSSDSWHNSCHCSQ